MYTFSIRGAKKAHKRPRVNRIIVNSRIITSAIIAITILLLAILVAHTVSTATQITVDSIGELRNAIDNVEPGDTVTIRGGTYRSASRFSFTRSGAPNNPITWQAYPGETVIFDGSNYTADGWEPPYLCVYADWNIFEGFEVANNPIGRGIRIDGSDNIFRHIMSHHNAGSGFSNEGGNRNQFLNVVGHNNIDPQDDGENADGIGIEAGVDNVVKHSVFYENSDDGVDTWQSIDNTIESCISYDNGLLSDGDGNGFKFGPGGSNSIIKCVAYNNRRNGFDNNGSSGSTVEHCTSHGNGSKAFYNGAGYPNIYRDNIHSGQADINGNCIEENNTWNLGISTPGFISTNPSSYDFLSLLSSSPSRNAASDGSDLGALQYGERTIDLVAVGEPPQPLQSTWQGNHWTTTNF